MEMNEVNIERWLVRGTKFFKTVARNPVVRGALLSRGLTDEELAHGWQLYSELHGFTGKVEAQPATKETAAAQAMNEVDAWDAPAYSAAHAVLDVRYPEASRFLFDNLEASTGVAAVVGVERFLDRLATLREGGAPNVDPANQRAAVALLATRKIIDERREGDLRRLIETARLGARPDEVIEPQEMDPRRRTVAEAYVNWLHEWREVARVAIHRRDYRIALGLAQRRQAGGDSGDDESEAVAEAQTPAATAPARAQPRAQA